MLKTLADYTEYAGKTVVARCNFDVTLTHGHVDQSATWRIESSLPFLRDLSRAGARTVIISHRGRPKGAPNPDFSLRPVFSYLERALSGTIRFSERAGYKAGNTLSPGECVLLENLRFDPREESNDETFAQELASLGDVFLNNDFATAHRALPSTVGITRHIPSFAGPLIQKEVAELESVRSAAEHPLIIALGGAKSETKLTIIDYFLDKADSILVGGVLANTFLKKKGYKTGISIVGETADITPTALESDRIVLPTDVVVSTSIDRAENVRVAAVDDVKPAEAIVDIGPKTRERFRTAALNAAAVLWNGPMGLVEIAPFDEGSRALAVSLADCRGRTTVGGGDVVSFLAAEKLVDKIDYVSTGGGSLLEFLAGKKLPALEALGYYEVN